MGKTKEKQEILFNLAQEFIDGQNRSKNHVQEIEKCFAELYDNEVRLEDLQYALSMFGAGNQQEDEKWLVSEFQYVITIINEEDS